MRYYGQWMRDEAEKRIGHLYPKVKITAEMAKDRPDLKELCRTGIDRHRVAVGTDRRSARTRPAAHSTFLWSRRSALSHESEKTKASCRPSGYDRANNAVIFEVAVGKTTHPTKGNNLKERRRVSAMRNAADALRVHPQEAKAGRMSLADGRESLRWRQQTSLSSPCHNAMSRPLQSVTTVLEARPASSHIIRISLRPATLRTDELFVDLFTHRQLVAT